MSRFDMPVVRDGRGDSPTRAEFNEVKRLAESGADSLSIAWFLLVLLVAGLWAADVHRRESVSERRLDAIEAKAKPS